MMNKKMKFKNPGKNLKNHSLRIINHRINYNKIKEILNKINKNNKNSNKMMNLKNKFLYNLCNNYKTNNNKNKKKTQKLIK